MYIWKRKKRCGLCMWERLLNLTSTSRIRLNNRTLLQRHRFKRNLVSNVRYSAVPINSSQLTTSITLRSSVITKLVYNDRKSFHDAITKFDCILIGLIIQTERAKRTGFMASTIASSHSRRFLLRLFKSWIMTESKLAFFFEWLRKKCDIYVDIFIVEEFFASQGQWSEFSELSINILSILRRCFADTCQVYMYLNS